MQPDKGPRPLILSSAAVLMLSIAALIGSLLLPSLRKGGLPAALAANGLAPRSVDCPIRHSVQSGETFSIIARSYGLEVSDLIEANELEDPNVIYVGQVLCLPAVAEPSGNQEPDQEPEHQPDQSTDAAEPSEVGVAASPGSDICVQGRVVDEQYRGLAGFTIAASTDGSDPTQAMTDVEGVFTFDGLAPGIWTFSQQLTRGWEAITPAQFVQPMDYGYGGCYPLRFQNREVLIPACLLVSKADEDNGSPLEGWEIQVRPFEGGAWISGTTDASGQVRFAGLEPGKWQVKEVVRYPWTAANPASGQQEVLLHPMNDADDCSRIQFRNRKLPTGCIEGSKVDDSHIGLSGQTICARPSGATEPVICTTTDGDGSFRLDELTLGEWIVWEELEAGWVGVTAGEFPVPVHGGDTCPQVRFKNRAPDLCLTGYKLDDQGFGLSDWPIRAWPKDRPEEALETATASDGSYRLCGLTLGTWLFEEQRRTGWKPLTDELQEIEVVFAGSEVDVEGPIFRNARPVGCIEGWSMDDLEVGLPLWPIGVSNIDSGQSWTAMTNGTGYFQICHLPLGDYQVSQEVQVGWKPLSPTRVDVSLVASDDDIVASAAFVSTQAARGYCVDGHVRDVVDSAGLPGWEVRLFNGDGQGKAASTTDGTGYFRFADLAPGDYWVQRLEQDAWPAASPESVSVTLAYPPSHECQRVEFLVGDSPAPPIAGCRVWHTVRYGETMAILSRRYGLSLSSLLAANDLANPNRIWPGQQICIP